MKKTLLIILAVLPIVLLVVIAVAGRILSTYEHISVERVEFVDRIGTAYTDDIDFIVPQGGKKATAIRIYPQLASNKKVTYTSSDTDICTVDENGVITGVHYGAAVVTVKTRDSARVASLNVVVTADTPFAVTLSHDEHSMLVGGRVTLTADVDAPVALDKRVRWSSSNTEVASVDAAGNVVALSPGETVITVTTVLGEKTASCKVTVLEDLPPVSFNFEGVDGVEATSNGYRVLISSVDILDHILLSDGVSADSITLELSSSCATLTDGVLTRIPGASGVATVTVYAGDKDAPDYVTSVKFLFLQ